MKKDVTIGIEKLRESGCFAPNPGSYCSKLLLDCLGQSQELEGREFCLYSQDAVEKPGLVGDIHGLRFIER